jgi:hypothetical protein
MATPESLPLHLDYTTVYAAGLALDRREREARGLPFSRLLALSQLVESIVLHESLQYECGITPDWAPYVEALNASPIGTLASEWGVPLLPSPGQVDVDEAAVLAAFKKALLALDYVPLDGLQWAVQMRSGTYGAVPRVDDNASNPMTTRYMSIVRAEDDRDFAAALDRAFARLSDNDIGPMGLHLLARIALHQAFWVEPGRAHYYPHFSRQPLMFSFDKCATELEEWMIERTSKRRTQILDEVLEGTPSDLLARSLSPIFLACLAKAQSPEGMIEQANELRNSDPAVAFRDERDAVLACTGAGDEGAIIRYKARLTEQMADLRTLLFERGSDAFVERQTSATFPYFRFGWQYSLKRVDRHPRYPGDRAAVFLGDVILQSIGIANSEERIRTVFGVPGHYDTRVLLGVAKRGGSAARASRGARR